MKSFIVSAINYTDAPIYKHWEIITIVDKVWNGCILFKCLTLVAWAIIEIFINARINILFDLKDGFGGMTKTVR